MGKEPKYEVLESYGRLEIRSYEPIIVAEVKCPGARKEAIQSGFKILASYIFGGNTTSTKFPMSVPVTQEKTDNGWRIRFMLTEIENVNKLPKPTNQSIKLLLIPRKKFAVVRFSGLANDEKIQKNTETLRIFAHSHEWTIHHKPILAFYNPPWTLPFLRRNEVMMEISK